MSKQKKYHYIYKTTCKITGKFYVGMHSTDNLEDGYLGSGKILGYSRNKYGDENHVREILEFVSSRDELKQREKEIVNEEMLRHPLNINLKYGGDGGWPTNSLEHQSNAGRLGGLTSKGNARFFTREQRANNGKNSIHQNRMLALADDVRAKRIATMQSREHNKGEKNSQFGTCWVTNGAKPIKIKKEQLDEYLSKGYSRGRKDGRVALYNVPVLQVFERRFGRKVYG